MNDTLLTGVSIEKADTVVFGIFAQSFNHLLSDRIRVRLFDFVSRHDVVDRRKSTMGVLHWETQVAKHAERLRAGHLVNQVSTDKELSLAVW